VSKPTLGPAKFPDFLDIVRRQLRTEYQESDITNQGLKFSQRLTRLHRPSSKCF
jgi:hypothetical protein